MEALVLTLHILACLILIVLVLLQSGKEGMGVIFGGGSSTVFGSSGAGGLLTRLTAFLAAIFLVTSLVYNILISPKKADESIMSGAVIEEPAAPAAPAPASSGADDINAPAPEAPAADDLGGQKAAE